MHHSQRFYQFLNLEVVFWDDVQHCLRFCLDHLSCVKMAAFQFYLHSGKQRKARWGQQSCYFRSKLPGEKGSVRGCVVVMQKSVLFVTKVRGKFFTHFHALAVWIHCTDHATILHPQKLPLPSPTSGSHSVGIVRLWTKA
jgi:hypothetical protein